MTDSELRQLKPVQLLELLIKTAQRGIELLKSEELKPFSDFVRPAREPLTVIGDFEIWARFPELNPQLCAYCGYGIPASRAGAYCSDRCAARHRQYPRSGAFEQ